MWGSLESLESPMMGICGIHRVIDVAWLGVLWWLDGIDDVSHHWEWEAGVC